MSERSEQIPKDSETFGTVKQAAAAYGLSERVLLNRLQTGQIVGRKEGKTWRVSLPAPTTSENSVPTDSEPSPHNADYSEQKAADSESVRNQYELMISHQAEEILFLRRQVETHQTNEAELRRLMLHDKAELQELRRKVSLLAVPPIDITPETVQEPYPVPLSDTEREASEKQVKTSVQQEVEAVQGVDKPLGFWHRVVMRWRGEE